MCIIANPLILISYSNPFWQIWTNNVTLWNCWYSAKNSECSAVTLRFLLIPVYNLKISSDKKADVYMGLSLCNFIVVELLNCITPWSLSFISSCTGHFLLLCWISCMIQVQLYIISLKLIEHLELVLICLSCQLFA